MSEDINLSTSNAQALVIPGLGKLPALSLDVSKIREAEVRYIEAKTVNPSTYADLEHTFNESYRDLKRYLSQIGYHITKAEKMLGEAKANVLLGAYADHMKDKPKYTDNTDLREAFLTRDKDYSEAQDKVAQLKALESNFEGKMKVVENVCRYMRKKMDLIIRSGLSSADYYNTQGKK